ncbi:MAG: ABC transporter permease [Bacteroidia bacterium]
MFKNYLKIALRNLVKYRSYSLINIIGLASSTAVAILIFIYSWNVLTYDQFHENSEDIYFVHRDRPGPDGATPVYDTWYPMLTALKADYPEIISGVRTVSGGNYVRYGEKYFPEEITWADKELFTVFDFPFKVGDPATALEDISSIVISQEIATKYFGNEDPMGKILTVGEGREHKVTGVLAPFPPNSTMNFSLVIPLHEGLPFMPEDGWGSSFFFTFIHVKPQTNTDELLAKFPEFVTKYIPEPERGDLHLVALKDYNNEFSGQRQYAYILLIISIGIILIASINFTNLATAHSMIRTKEVGVRKVLGATRSRLVFQFLAEAILMSLLALAIGAGIADLLLPTFNELVDMELVLDYFSNYKLVLAILGLGILVGYFTGIYPSAFLSRLQPTAPFFVAVMPKNPVALV